MSQSHPGFNLTNEQLIAQTGYRQACKQIEWFRKELGIDPPIGADGRPRISQAVIDQATIARQAGVALSNMHTTTKAPGPKWSVPA